MDVSSGYPPPNHARRDTALLLVPAHAASGPGSSAVPSLTRGHAQGDILLGMNGQLVMGRSVEELKPFILGPVGSPIELFIQRGAGPMLSNARASEGSAASVRAGTRSDCLRQRCAKTARARSRMQEAHNSPCSWYAAGGQAAAAARAVYDQTCTASAAGLGAAGAAGAAGGGAEEQRIP